MQATNEIMDYCRVKGNITVMNVMGLLNVGYAYAKSLLNHIVEKGLLYLEGGIFLLREQLDD